MENLGFQIVVKSNALPVGKRIRAIGSKQMPFATARALTWTAKEAQIELRNRLPDTFVIRRKWVPGGIIITPAKKQSLTARVGSRDDFMAEHATGAKRRPKRTRRMAVKPYESISQVKARSRRARKATGRRKPFVITFASGKSAVVRRKRIKTRYPLEILKLLEREVDIRKRWPFEEQVARVVEKEFPRLFEKSFDQALKD